ncbi:MAG: hypothetical protein ACI9MF_000261 [Gammaproteobacteria bacterium]|jgi:hypothetical protein
MMSKAKSHKAEKQILDDFETGQFKSVLTSKRKKFIQSVADENL